MIIAPGMQKDVGASEKDKNGLTLSGLSGRFHCQYIQAS